MISNFYKLGTRKVCHLAAEERETFLAWKNTRKFPCETKECSQRSKGFTFNSKNTSKASCGGFKINEYGWRLGSAQTWCLSFFPHDLPSLKTKNWKFVALRRRSSSIFLWRAGDFVRAVSGRFVFWSIMWHFNNGGLVVQSYSLALCGNKMLCFATKKVRFFI